MANLKDLPKVKLDGAKLTGLKRRIFKRRRALHLSSISLLSATSSDITERSDNLSDIDLDASNLFSENQETLLKRQASLSNLFNEESDKVMSSERSPQERDKDKLENLQADIAKCTERKRALESEIQVLETRLSHLQESKHQYFQKLKRILASSHHHRTSDAPHPSATPLIPSSSASTSPVLTRP